MKELFSLLLKPMDGLVKLPEDIIWNEPEGTMSSLQRLFREVSITAGFSLEVVKRLIKRKGYAKIVTLPFSRYARFCVGIGGDGRALNIITGEIPSYSKNSQAVYYAQGFIEPNWGMLIQWLPPNAKTSFHYHCQRQEIVIPLLGIAVIKTPLGERFIDKKGILIPKEISHQTVNPSLFNPFISVIFVEGIQKGDSPLKGDHHFSEKHLPKGAQ